MKISLKWLEQYAEIPVDAKRLAHDLTMLGLNVEELIEIRPDWQDVFVATVLETRPHPNADRLTLCKVTIEPENPQRIYDVVCGAPNVRADLRVAFAPPGSVIAGGNKLKKVKLRGEVSEGMILSEEELGLGDDSAGIIELPAELVPGTPLEEHLGDRDWLLDIEVTPNRPDWLCHLGVAREVAALYGTPLRSPDDSAPDSSGEENPIEVVIEDSSGCPQFLGRYIRGVRIESSPSWMQAALRSIGLRPINNVVDITNYVLHELGHPQHAYDADKIGGGRIVVRRAQEGERLETLDGSTRTLESSDLVIADAGRAVGLAGIMGGANTEVGESTQVVFLESAYFDPKLVRRSRIRLGLSTDASYRFERQADREGPLSALNRATRLILEIAGGEVVGKTRDARGDAAPSDEPISLRTERVNRLLGTSLESADVQEALARLQIPARVDEEVGGVVAQIPSFRRDLLQEVDLVEEVARIYGYEKFEREDGPRITCYAVRDPFETFGQSLAQRMVAVGFAEVVTSSFMESRSLDRLQMSLDDPRRSVVPVVNPLTSLHEVLRTILLPGLLEVVRTNLAQGLNDLRLFEMGKVFRAAEGGGLPDERLMLSLLVRGSSRPSTWRGDGSEFDYYDLKGVVEILLEGLGVDTQNAFCYSGGAFELDQPFRYPETGPPIVHGGTLSSGALRQFDLPGPLYYAEADVLDLYEMGWKARGFQELARFPAVKRDLSLVLPAGVTYQQLAASIRESGGRYLENVTLFDSYSGEGLGEGSKAYGVHLTFRSKEETLADRTVDRQIGKILGELEQKLDVKLRS